ncbi:HNH endonuclease signature motif containing protein [Streptomyces albogriseolus]
MLASSLCADCRAPEVTARGRCKNCYYRHIAALKASGEFLPKDISRPLLDRLLSKTTPGFGGCVVWTGGVNKKNYGITSVMAAPRKQRRLYAHRAAYELFIGPIPEGMQVDHLCHNRDAECPGGDTCRHRRCINPHHLEAVSPQENQRRSPRTFPSLQGARSTCVNGHPFDEVNTYIRPDTGGRQCKQCRHDRAVARKSGGAR